MKVKTHTILLIIVAAGLVPPGCGWRNWFSRSPSQTQLSTGKAIGGDLSTTVMVDRRIARIGDKLDISLMAENTSSDPIPVEADTTAPMLVTVWRYNMANGWQRAKVYPEVSITQRSAWVLQRHEKRKFFMTVPVEPDWPTLELLRITAELNGRPDVRPFVLIEISPQE
ncbi:MAG: hypothetical protein HQ546_08555 [Planctomycetes bacterium]|nr:hypothetical protein [Planctomycetota bacterium]